ncbi:hypothetical protein OROMI_014676 [Orobanche minor]
MASSQTTSISEKKKETIIDGRFFIKSVIMNRIQTENDDSAAMAHVVSRIKRTGLFNIGRQHSELYDESLVEEFYQEASVRVRSEKKGGGVAEIFASIRGVEVRDSADKKVHPSCLKRRFVLPFVYLHDFCCRVVENCTDAFEMCTNLRFRMMVAIMFGEPVNWCQGILKRLQEEVSKPLSQKKSFGLILTKIFSCLDVPFAEKSKKIGPGKFIGGSKPTAFNKDVIPVDRPSILELPQSKVVHSNKRKHSLSDTVPQPAAPEKKKKKLRKAHKPKPTEVSATPVEAQVEKSAEVAQPTAINLQGATPAEESANRSPVRASTPAQDPSPHREPTPVRDPSPIREPTLVRIPTSEQASIPVADSNPTVKPIRVRSPSPTQLINDTLLSVQVEQAFERVKVKAGKTAFARTFLFSLFKPIKPRSSFQTSPAPSRKRIQSLCSIRRKLRDSSPPVPSSTEPQVPETSVPRDESPQQPAAKPTVDAPASPSSQHMVEILEDRLIYPTHRAALLMLTGPEEPVIRQESPKSALWTERLEALGHQTVFIQDAVSSLHNVGKALDKLNLSAAEEIGGVTSYLNNIANALQVLPQLIKVALSNIQQKRKELMEIEQAKFTSFAARSVGILSKRGNLLGYKNPVFDNCQTVSNSKQSSAKEGSVPDRPYSIIHTVLVRPSAYSSRRLKYSRIEQGKLYDVYT